MKCIYRNTQSFILKGCFLLSLLVMYRFTQAQRLSNREERYYQQNILRYINQYRTQKGLNALMLDDGLSTIAYMHSRDMSRGNVAFGHDGFNDRMAKARLSNSKLAGFAENVAYGMQTPQEVSQDWYGSSGHRRNMLGNYLLTGIGVERADDGYLYFTQVFER
ncbi:MULTISPECIES: CAP domain-containing protein [Chitinophagaceae]